MKRTKIALSGIALVGVASLALAGCSTGGSTPTKTDGGAEGGAGDSAAIITTNGTEPQNPLIPTNTNEVGGGKILDAIFAGLIYYDADGKPVNDMAEKIETVDAQTVKVTIKKGQKFTDGTEVKSDNFIKAWQYGAKFSNEQLSSYFFEDIEGYDAEKDSELTGLVKDDDYNFTIKLSKPASDFALRLGYSAFYPLPDAAFDDIEAFGQNPIGNGPYKFDGEGAWEHNAGVDLVKNDDYAGGRTAQNGGLKITFYASAEAAYADLLGGQVDIIDLIPPSSLATFESDLGERAVNQPAAVFQSFTIPERLEHFKGEEGQLRRQALSMAINRDEITKVIFQGTRTPASDFTSPVIDGWSDKLAGSEVLQFNPEEAKKKWAEADKISPWSGKFQIGYNSDGGHQEWVDAVTNSIKDTLGIDASGAPYATFQEIREKVTNRQITTAFRTGWQADYPGLYNFLGPLYATGAGSNDGDYSSAEFNKLLADGIGSADAETASADFQKAQEVLLKDLPVIPTWYSNVTGGYGEGVENVEFGWNSVPLYYQVTKK